MCREFCTSLEIMPSCAVKWCINQSHVHKKDDGISFHIFPQNETRRRLWTKAVRLERQDRKWMPSKNRKICSIHFRDEDFYLTKKGNYKLKITAVPICTMVFAIVKPMNMTSSATILEPNLQLQASPSKTLPLTPSPKTYARSNKKNEDTIEEYGITTKYCNDKETEIEMIIKEECDGDKYSSNVDCEMTAVDHQASKITMTVEDPLLEPRRHSSIRLPEQSSVHVDQTRVTVEDPLLEVRRHSSSRLPTSSKPSISSQPPTKRLRSKSPTEKKYLEDINQRLLALEESRIEADMELARAMNRQTAAIEEMLGLAKYFVNLYEKNNVQQSASNNEQVPSQPCKISQIHALSESTEIEGLVLNIKKEME